MIRYAARRFTYMLVLLWLVSVMSFVIIQLPPGDYVTVLVAEMEQYQNVLLTPEEVAQLRHSYGLDRPLYAQYAQWMGRLLRGDLGTSVAYQRPVADLLRERMPLTVLISVTAMVFVWIVAVPIGIYSATRQYSLGDYLATALGFVGMATPPFLLALLFMYLGFRWFGFASTGLLSSEYIAEPWSAAKVLDLLMHLPLPVVVIGIAGTAGLIRVLRATLLDELDKPYVVTARAKGVPEGRLLLKYPVRVAVNPLVSTIGWSLAGIVSGATIVDIVLNLPTTGPLLLDAIMKQDMALAGSIIMILSALTVIGTFVSDVLLVLVDPRIRHA